MTLAQLRYLVAIIDAGLNVTEAAARVNATQSGLSQQLKLLEDELGFQIFVRRGRKLDRVSDGGAAVIDSARRIVAETHNIDALAANQRGDAEGDLRIFTTQAQAQYVLPTALAGLRQRFPDVRVHLGLDAGSGRSLTDASFDVAIVSPAQPDFANAVAIPLYRWSWQLLVPATATAPSRYRDVSYTVHIESPASKADVDGLRDVVEATCPVYNLLKDSQTIKGSVVRGRYQPPAAS